ncbi:MAG: carbamoyltransferase family protein [Anaerolineae bacterium]
MKVLGIYDWHNAGASLVEDGRLIAAIEEERLSRNKIEFGFPYRSIEAVMRITNTNWAEIDAVAVAGVRDPIFFARWQPHLFKFRRKMGAYWSFQYALWRAIYAARDFGPLPSLERFLSRRIVEGRLKALAGIPPEKIFLVDHHLAHAASGYRTSGFDRALVFALDGSGDGHSSTVFRGEGGELTFLAGASERASLGKLYSNVTLGLGFKKISDEGKVMGLAAHGDPGAFYPIIDPVIRIRDLDTLDMEATEDLVGNTFAKKIKNIYSQRYSREDISAAVQRKLEETVCAIVEHFVKREGIAKVVFVGGVASNVKMNQRVREMECVQELFIFPNMTDGGLSSGAALEVCYQEGKKRGKIFPPYKLPHVFLGPDYSEEEIAEAIRRNKLKAEWVEDINSRIAELVASGKIVARFTGKMEFGPRALGHRSTLALPSAPGIEDELNRRFKRDEFMPFAPSLLEEYAAEYLVGGQRSPYMVETFTVADGYSEKFPAVIHVDHTLRPQTVDRETTPGYWEIIKKVGDLTGLYIVLNTSYNMHGEPIVCSPQDALNTFRQGCVDYLAMGHYLIKYPGDEGQEEMNG